MGAKTSPRGGIAPLMQAIASQGKGLVLATANGQTYILNQSGNCIYVQGSDISQVPMGCYSTPSESSTGLSGPGTAILIGSTWYSLAALTDQNAAHILPDGIAAVAGANFVPADSGHVHVGTLLTGFSNKDSGSGSTPTTPLPCQIQCIGDITFTASSAGTAISLPATFPNACLAVVAISLLAADWFTTPSFTTSTVTLKAYNASGQITSGSMQACVIAIGW
jgi:hypothetical protein